MAVYTSWRVSIKLVLRLVCLRVAAQTNRGYTAHGSAQTSKLNQQLTTVYSEQHQHRRKVVMTNLAIIIIRRTHHRIFIIAARSSSHAHITARRRRDAGAAPERRIIMHETSEEWTAAAWRLSTPLHPAAHPHQIKLVANATLRRWSGGQRRPCRPSGRAHRRRRPRGAGSR